MIRNIIKIDAEKCNGCGACANACHEGAIAMVNGKAKLIRDDYCDGLGDCLPACPTGAISVETRDADEYNKTQANLNKENLKKNDEKQEKKIGCSCVGTQPKELSRQNENINLSQISSQLMQWPVEIKLAPTTAPYYQNANLLIAADCTAYAYGDFHNKFMKKRITLIGCSKLDNINYTEKLTEIISNNSIKNVTVVRMDVPCCGGIEIAVKNALKNSGKFIPWQVITISTKGDILEY